MSVDRECSQCGEEYDARYGKCPVCKGKSPRARLNHLIAEARAGVGVFGDLPSKLPGKVRDGIADAITLIAQCVPEQLITEAYLDYHCKLSDVASERVTWEAASALIEAEAVSRFLAGNDTDAHYMRELSKTFREKAKDASERQSVLLKKQGVG